MRTSLISSLSMSMRKLRHFDRISLHTLPKQLIALIPASLTAMESSSSISSKMPVTCGESSTEPCSVCCPAADWPLLAPVDIFIESPGALDIIPAIPDFEVAPESTDEVVGFAA